MQLITKFLVTRQRILFVLKFPGSASFCWYAFHLSDRVACVVPGIERDTSEVSSFKLNLQSLPEYKHVQGVRLAGSAFADALMVVEFLNTFGSALDLG